MNASTEQVPGSGNGLPANSRILIVEDNAINQEVALNVLEDLDLKADVAENGQEALACLANADSPYNLVLMDCQMPVMDGYEATASIRSGKAGPQNTDIVIIAMTANALRGDRERCLAAGMNDYMSKPVDFDVLQSLLLKWLPATVSLGDASKDEQVLIKDGDLYLPSQLKTINFSEKRPDIARRKTTFLKLLGIYIAQNVEFLAKAKALHAAKDATGLREHIHAIKGAAGNLGMMSLFSKAAEYEEKLRLDDWVSDTDLASFLALVEQSFSDAAAIIEANKADAQPASEKPFVETSFNLISKLERHAVVDDKLINEFRASAVANLSEAEISTIVGYLESFDYSDALDALRKAL